jgi:hypothetical protein
MGVKKQMLKAKIGNTKQKFEARKFIIKTLNPKL